MEVCLAGDGMCLELHQHTNHPRYMYIETVGETSFILDLVCVGSLPHTQ